MSEDQVREGSRDATPVDAHLPEVQGLCRRFGVRRLDVFGSAATGRFDPARSDLDFLVEYEPDAPAKAHFGLLRALEDLFGKKVDLLTERGLQNPYLRRRIDSERRTLYPSAMVSNQAATFLWDARRAAERVARFAAGRNYNDYLADDMLRAAVERQFEIIGEALAGLRRLDPATAAQLPHLSQVIAFRNVLIHAYATIDDRLVWDVVENDLPGLLARLIDLLGTAPPP